MVATCEPHKVENGNFPVAVEIDLDDGRYWADPELAQKYREQTLNFVKGQLGLDDSLVAFKSGDAIIDSFDIIGKALKGACSVEQREKFISELAFFMEKSEVEQRLRLQTQVVTAKDFWQYRVGTSAVRVVLCLNEYCNESALSSRLQQDQSVTALSNLTNANICLVNDLLSVKKELAQGSLESLVPILSAMGRSAQTAADEVTEAVNTTVTEFDAVAKTLLQCSEEREDSETVKALVAFTAGCRNYCTGNLGWR
ncbi:hypothetical protein ACLMJK_003487 [Lecanora helva]